MIGRHRTRARAWGLGLLALAGLFLIGGTALAAEATLKLMIGSVRPESSYTRLIQGTCLAETVGGATQSVSFENGYLTLVVPSPGTTNLTITGVALDWPDFPGRRFRVVFDDEGTMRAFDLEDPDETEQGRVRELGTSVNADGSHHFYFFKDGLFIFQWADPQGPIMGPTLDWAYEAYQPAGGHRTWTMADLGGKSMFRAWPFADPQGRVPGLILTWIHPDLTQTLRYFPGAAWGEESNGNLWLTEVPVEGYAGITSMIWKWRMDWSSAFIRSLANGTHTLIFELESPAKELSNRRLETVTINME